MPNKKLTNKDILNSIRNEMSAEYQSVIPVAATFDGSDVAKIMEDYPTHKNAFIDALTNKIAKSMFFSKLFNNPYKMLHKGLLPYGTNIEQLFVEMAEKKGFDEHWTGSDSAEGDLIKAVNPIVDVCYIKQNFRYKFKTSISHAQLRGAFQSPNGLSELLNQIVNSLYSSSNYAEFLDMKKILTNATADNAGGSEIGQGLVQQIGANANKANMTITLEDDNPATMVKAMRAMAGRMTFPSDKYNLAGVKTWCNPQDLVVFITPELQAELDVDVLAHAFNVSKTDINLRILLIDDLGNDTDGKAIKAIMADKDIIQCYDTVHETRTFENGDQLHINYFAHKHGIMAGCKFANALIFV